MMSLTLLLYRYYNSFSELKRFAKTCIVCSEPPTILGASVEQVRFQGGC